MSLDSLPLPPLSFGSLPLPAVCLRPGLAVSLRSRPRRFVLRCARSHPRVRSGVRACACAYVRVRVRASCVRACVCSVRLCVVCVPTRVRVRVRAGVCSARVCVRARAGPAPVLHDAPLAALGHDRRPARLRRCARTREARALPRSASLHSHPLACPPLPLSPSASPPPPLFLPPSHPVPLIPSLPLRQRPPPSLFLFRFAPLNHPT